MDERIKLWGKDLRLSSDSIEDDQCEVITATSENIQVQTDYTEQFTTTMVFKCREELIQWARAVGRTVGFVLTIASSNQGEFGQKPYLLMQCERSGHYWSIKISSKKTDTRKCNCPFRLKSIKLEVGNDWVSMAVCGIHNHPAAYYMEGHSYAGRLLNDETGIMIDLSKNLVKPRDILSTLKARDPLNVSTIKTIYDARQKHRAAETTGRSQMQQLMFNLNKHDYILWHRSHVGVTSTELTISVAFVFIQFEKEDNFAWALSCLRSTMDGYSFASSYVPPAPQPRRFSTDTLLKFGQHKSSDQFPTIVHPNFGQHSYMDQLHTDLHPEFGSCSYVDQFFVELYSNFGSHSYVDQFSTDFYSEYGSHSYVHQFPPHLLPYITFVTDVIADGNCGFHSVAMALRMDERQNAWATLRYGMLTELNNNVDGYASLYGSYKRVSHTREVLTFFESDRPAPLLHWMNLTDMGHLIASWYNVVFILISESQSMTFLPLRSAPPPPHEQHVICIGHVNQNHFVEVSLVPNSPMPRIMIQWGAYKHQCATQWVLIYEQNFEDCKRIWNPSTVSQPTVHLDSD
ncbi:protein FAR1-RELATED SEQUENCE 2 isoform X2 [Cinnamomum micranthum f. kanehirae]|uniref:Protein FAR1-RELATED SEQUENCE 2 isoform X2 n=1 Tax=Cinnamomum micranthum f. kanehirae TaxID=337451 RepID=A0A443P287_9MAGN|nr:protein FAR1-RELATED SEQUENCE 2 isoform X2 [Cinnamomum micranthum f. kanehirae]